MSAEAIPPQLVTCLTATVSPTRRPEPASGPTPARPWRDGAILLATATLLVAAQWALARWSPGWSQSALTTVASVIPLMTLLAIPALIGLLVTPLLSRLPASRTALWTMLAAGLAMRVVWYGVPVTIDDDYFRYLWDGAVLASGHNPYAFPPKAALDGTGFPAALAPLVAKAAEVLKLINFPELVSIYPGTAELAFGLANLIAPLKLDGLRLVFLAAELAGLWIVLLILKDLQRPPLAAALYWLNPLLVWSSHGTGHSEALMAPLLLGAVYGAWRARDTLAAALLALAVGVKLWPALLAPLLARHITASGRPLLLPALVFLGLSAGLTAPLAFSTGFGMRSGLVAYSEHWWTNNAPFAWASYGLYVATEGSPLAQRALRGLILAAVGAWALWLAMRPIRDLRSLLSASLAIAAAMFYAAPAQFPWYALWFLPLAAAVESRPLLLASATLAIYYMSIPLSAQGIGEVHNYGWAFLHALPVWAWVVWEAHRMGSLLRPHR